MRGFMLFMAVLAIGAVGMTDAQETPVEVYTRQPIAWEQRLFDEFPEWVAGMEPALPKWVFDGLRPSEGPKQGERWYREMRACLVDEGYELRATVADYEDLKFYLFREGWSFRDHRGTQLKGAWYPGIIVLEIAEGRTELTIRHEMIHELIGLTRHPLTASVVGPCQPGLMLDRLHGAESQDPRRALPFGRFGFPQQRVGPRTRFHYELMGGAGVQLGPLRNPRGAGLFREVYPGQPRWGLSPGEARAVGTGHELGTPASDGGRR